MNPARLTAATIVLLALALPSCSAGTADPAPAGTGPPAATLVATPTPAMGESCSRYALIVNPAQAALYRSLHEPGAVPGQYAQKVGLGPRISDLVAAAPAPLPVALVTAAGAARDVNRSFTGEHLSAWLDAGTAVQRVCQDAGVQQEWFDLATGVSHG